jgi:hypothetical protein
MKKNYSYPVRDQRVTVYEKFPMKPFMTKLQSQAKLKIKSKSSYTVNVGLYLSCRRNKNYPCKMV